MSAQVYGQGFGHRPDAVPDAHADGQCVIHGGSECASPPADGFGTGFQASGARRVDWQRSDVGSLRIAVEQWQAMKIYHYQPYFLGPECGTGNAARGWTEALARAGHDVAAIVDGSISNRPAPPGVRILPLEHGSRGNLRAPKSPSGAIRGADLVVIHGGWTLGNIAVGRACAGVGVPFVVTTHGVYAPEVFETRRATKATWLALLERPHVRRALALHFFFPEQTAQQRRLGVQRPSVVAANGISVPEGMRWDGGSGGYLLWLGRFHPVQKGLDLLVRAVASMPPSARPEIRLHGPDWRGQKDVLRTMVRDLGVEPWVRILDPVYGDQKWDLICRAGGCVFPSRSDACPVAVAESVALGVPTLVTGYAMGSFLAARGAAIGADLDPSSVARGLGELTTAAARETGERAWEVARASFSWDQVAHTWMGQVRDLLASERNRV